LTYVPPVVYYYTANEQLTTKGKTDLIIEDLFSFFVIAVVLGSLFIGYGF